MNRELNDWQMRQNWNELLETPDDTRRQNVLETIGTVAALLGVAILTWLFIVATPDQRSAEADAAAVAMGDAR